MNISNQMNVQGKPKMDIKGGTEKQLLKAADVAKEPHTEAKEGPPPVPTKAEPAPLAAQTRNISFKVNENEEMYVEVTNADNEVVRTIPADENDPKFMALIQHSTPGAFIDRKG